MPAYVTETIIWIAVIAFAACMVAGVLMIFGVLEPKDPTVRKWLFGGFLVVVVGAVAQFGVRQFGSQPTAEQPRQPNRPRPVPAAPPRSPGGNETPEKPPSAPEPGPGLNPPQAPPIPTEVQSWAEETLGPRPVLQANAEQQYPSCVARLSNAGVAADVSDALSCRRDLQQFHMDVIVAYYDAKRPYDRNLELQEAALRKGGLLSDELPEYNYIIAEMDRLNGADSAEESAVHSLEERVLADISRCAKSACR